MIYTRELIKKVICITLKMHVNKDMQSSSLRFVNEHNPEIVMIHNLDTAPVFHLHSCESCMIIKSL